MKLSAREGLEAGARTRGRQRRLLEFEKVLQRQCGWLGWDVGRRVLRAAMGNMCEWCQLVVRAVLMA